MNYDSIQRTLTLLRTEVTNYPERESSDPKEIEQESILCDLLSILSDFTTALVRLKKLEDDE